MADSDSSSYIVRQNLVNGIVEYFVGSDWYPSSNGKNSPLTAVSSNVGPVTVYNVTVSGMYLIGAYIVNTATGSGADAVGQLVINYTDPSGGNALYANMPSGINATLLGSTTAAVYLMAGSSVTYTEGSGVFAGGLIMDVKVSVTKI